MCTLFYFFMITAYPIFHYTGIKRLNATGREFSNANRSPESLLVNFFTINGIYEIDELRKM